MVDIYRFGQKLALVIEDTQPKSTLQMSRLERSIASTSSRNFMNDSTQPLAQFLQSMGIFLRNMVEAELGDSRAGKVSALNHCQIVHG